MRPSFVTGVLFFAIGLGFSVLANGMLDTTSPHLAAVYATSIATVFFVVVSAIFLGSGAGMIIHWVIGLHKSWKAGVLNIILATALLFAGIGATIGFALTSGWTALQVFFTCLTAAFVLFLGSFVNFSKGLGVQVKKFKRKWKKVKLLKK